MAQNTSNAVMASRVEAHDSLDFFPTPPWATRALCEHVIGNWPGHLAWDPACGNGDMFRPLCERFLACAASDVYSYGWSHIVHDFLQPYLPDGIGCAEWIITNPPFRLGREFIDRALEIASHEVAMLVRTSFIESSDRYFGLFKDRPPSIVAQFVERVPMVKGRLDKEASTATSYCWLVWAPSKRGGTELVWIPPCRKALELPGDYEAAA